MSRYDVPVKAGSGASSAAIGWDRPLQTFFVQICRLEDGEEVSFLWEGTDYQALPTAANAIRLIEACCEVPADTGSRLEIDRLKTSGRADGEHQIAARQFIQRQRGV